MTSRRTLGALALFTAAALLTACSSGPAPAAPTATAAPPATPAPPARDQAAACTAQVSLDSTVPPGGADPSSPPPSAAEMQAYAARVAPFLTVVEQNAPPGLSSSVAQYAASVDLAKQGKPIDVTSAENVAASNALDRWVHDSCGFPTLDVVNDGGTVSPVGVTLQPGPVAVRFTNSGDPKKAGFVLLLGRVKDGRTATPAEVDSGKADIEEVADILTGVVPTGRDPGYGVAVLKPGDYLVSMVLGTPPAFAGSVTTAFTVNP